MVGMNIKIYHTTPNQPRLRALTRSERSHVRAYALRLLGTRRPRWAFVPSLLSAGFGAIGAYLGGCVLYKVLPLDTAAFPWTCLAGVGLFGAIGGLFGRYLLNRQLVLFWDLAFELYQAETESRRNRVHKEL